MWKGPGKASAAPLRPPFLQKHYWAWIWHQVQACVTAEVTELRSSKADSGFEAIPKTTPLFIFVYSSSPPTHTRTLKVEIVQTTESSPSLSSHIVSTGVYSCPPRIHPFSDVNAHSNCDFPSLISPRKETSLHPNKPGLSIFK